MPAEYDPIWDSEHLFNSPHLSGNSAGTANTDIYVPGNFQGQPTRPSPGAGVVLINLRAVLEADLCPAYLIPRVTPMTRSGI